MVVGKLREDGARNMWKADDGFIAKMAANVRASSVLVFVFLAIV